VSKAELRAPLSHQSVNWRAVLVEALPSMCDISGHMPLHVGLTFFACRRDQNYKKYLLRHSRSEIVLSYGHTIERQGGPLQRNLKDDSPFAP
jgi:hypothetical protein